jgi:hypothetical protein
MNIGQFAKKPELIKIVIDNPDIVEAYGSDVNFWIYDSVDINTYFEFFRSQSEGNGEKINELLRQLIRDEAGNLAIEDGNVLPIDLALASLTAINDCLGKSRTKPSTQNNGTQPD